MKIEERGVTQQERYQIMVQNDTTVRRYKCWDCDTVISMTYQDLDNHLRERYVPKQLRPHLLHMPDYNCPICGSMRLDKVRKKWWQR